MKLGFDLAIIEQLGEKLYTLLPPILAEYISNSYDADANNVIITIKEISKNPFNYTIEIVDDGSGIADNSDDIEKKFLSFGRKKRLQEGKKYSEKFKRLYHGKKGVGKLAGFGCGRKLTIDTLSNNVQNKFIIDLDVIENNIKSNKNDYYPEHIIKDKKIENLSSYTKITLENHIRKTKIVISDLANSIVQKLQVFDNSTNCNYFKCNLIYEDLDKKREELFLKNEMYFESIIKNTEQQFSWEIKDFIEGKFSTTLIESEKNFFKEKKIEGLLFTSRTPLQNKSGIIVYCRGKLAEEKTFFVDRDNDTFYGYFYGKIDADFIDEDDYEDNISTARININWEKVAPEFKEGMKKIVKKIQSSWRKEREIKQEEELKTKFGIDINNLKFSNNSAENRVGIEFAKKIAKIEDMPLEKVKEYIEDIKKMFKFQTFKDIVTNIVSSELNSLSEEKILDYIKEWNVVEYGEYSKIAVARIEALKVFEKMIENRESERDKIQPFLEKWPWLLDPRIYNFEREVTYEKWLKEEYPEGNLDSDDSNRRMDFYCVVGNGYIFIIELKKPGLKIDAKMLTQTAEYKTFISRKYSQLYPGAATPTVISILVVEPNDTKYGLKLFKEDNATITQKEVLVDTGKIIVQSYSELIRQARGHNEELIKRYEEFLNEENKD
ncbi:ATP-binding protein [Fusobacterium polymorphum]|uniref:ATP-binding protein n=1 Tax=Fusobacterium nucleatum subsp. polymorphum TaxID=76857 RepID=UPI00300A4A31